MIALVDSGVANLTSVRLALLRLGAEVTVTADPDIVRGASHVVLPGVGSAGPAMAKLRERGLIEVLQGLTQPLLGICLGMQLLFEDSEEGAAGGGATCGAGVCAAACSPPSVTPAKAGVQRGNSLAFEKEALDSGFPRKGTEEIFHEPSSRRKPGSRETDGGAVGNRGTRTCLGLIPGRVELLPAAPETPVPHMGWSRLTLERPDHPLLHAIPADGYVYFVHSYAVVPGPFTLATAHHGVPFTAIAGRDNVMGCQFHPERSGPLGAQVLRNFVGM